MENLSQFAKRAQTQKMVYYDKADDACKAVYDLIKNTDSAKYEKALRKMKIDQETIDSLNATCEDLCSQYERRSASSPEWLETYTRRYQAKQDDLALDRIKHHSLRCAAIATISRIPSLDQFIVLSSIFGMVKDLLAIYNVKPSKFNTFVLVLKIIIHVFCAGFVQSAVETLGESASKILESLCASVPVVGSVLGSALKLTAEAGAHAVLVYRCGRVAQHMLQPVRNN